MDNQSLSRPNLPQSYYKKKRKKHNIPQMMKVCQKDLLTKQIKLKLMISNKLQDIMKMIQYVKEQYISEFKTLRK